MVSEWAAAVANSQRARSCPIAHDGGLGHFFESAISRQPLREPGLGPQRSARSAPYLEQARGGAKPPYWLTRPPSECDTFWGLRVGS